MTPMARGALLILKEISSVIERNEMRAGEFRVRLHPRALAVFLTLFCFFPLLFLALCPFFTARGVDAAFA